ncbi:proprotein convertase subtilisin/kexin type 5-like [Saccostrea echinata]|uniref:proprotein convertase subtilisin/kexin type 5-like n=1 Tax=Saccostrea echinata TaxID=191078 RepID=UPI002A81DA2B|nr:proprotein convertase subtilisin/kexin type 5-like [Saccostrea echinata]
MASYRVVVKNQKLVQIGDDRLDAKLLTRFSDIGKRSCCRKCVEYTNCQSVNYNVFNFSCELNYVHSPGLQAKNAHGEYVYMDKTKCSSLVSPCENFCNRSCIPNQKCVLTNSTEPRCVITECGSSSVIPDITPRNVRREVGKQHWFDCTIPPTPSKQHFTCDTNGKWKKSFSACQCWYGRYLEGSSCKKCPAGKYLPHIGKMGSDSCINCPAGNYTQNEGQSWCKPCLAGHYQSNTGQTSCSQCQVGRYNPKDGASTCIPCPHGKYADSAGALSCEFCPTGKFSDNVGSSVCKECPAGTFSNTEGATMCQQCPPGKFSSTSGSSSCIPCPIGHYQDQEGSTECKPCDSALVEGLSFCVI